MALLLDSHVFHWSITGHPNLSPEVSKMIETNHVFVSIASLWELIIKASNQKLQFDISILAELKGRGYNVLAINTEHVKEYYFLPKIHKDPFDRMIIAQAKSEQLLLVTADQEMIKYNVKFLEVINR